MTVLVAICRQHAVIFLACYVWCADLLDEWGPLRTRRPIERHLQASLPDSTDVNGSWRRRWRGELAKLGRRSLVDREVMPIVAVYHCWCLANLFD
jgi:hypothetical protein